MLQRGIIVGLLWVLLCGIWGCRETRKDKDMAPAKGLLYVRVKQFNKFLRWRYYQRAKALVGKDKKSHYMMLWEKERPHLRITDMQIRDANFSNKNKEAEVLVVMKCYRLPSVTLKRIVYQQYWKAHKGNWYYQEDRKSGIKDCGPPVK